MLSLLLAFAGGCAHVPHATAPSHVRAAVQRIDWTTTGDEAARALSGYLQVDTRNPPGNERAGAEYLAKILRDEGIASEIADVAPGRAQLVARLPGTGKAPPLCLLSHIDVATAEASRWTHGPLSGEIDDQGRIWGRGALDMKSTGIMELMTVLLLHRQKIPLNRDLVLLASADEEEGNTGAQALAARWTEFGCSHLLNEGGVGVKDVFFEGQTVYPISVAEKGALWIQLTARGEPGHGSTPRPGQATDRLLRAIERVKKIRHKPDIQPPMLDLLAAIGRDRGGVAGMVLRSPFLVRLLVTPKLLANPATAATITNTINVTGFGGAKEPNVLPSEVWALLDVRLLPGTSSDEMLARLGRAIDDPMVDLRVISKLEAEESRWDDPLFRALVTAVRDGRDRGIAVGPFISVATSDSQVIRPLGVTAYGIAPIELTKDELATMHGDDEYVSTANLRDGVRRLFSAIVAYAAEPTGSRTAADPASPAP
jgi:acetylornithine deacetylase/succinyl-diaminopimelate desuccinylase-like protein